MNARCIDQLSLTLQLKLQGLMSLALRTLRIALMIGPVNLIWYNNSNGSGHLGIYGSFIVKAYLAFSYLLPVQYIIFVTSVLGLRFTDGHMRRLVGIFQFFLKKILDIY